MVLWGALVLLSLWIVVALFLVDGSGEWRSWVPVWVITFGLLSVPGLVVTWRWMGRDAGGSDTHTVGTDAAAASPGQDQRGPSSERVRWIIGVAITAVAGLHAATGDPNA